MSDAEIGLRVVWIFGAMAVIWAVFGLSVGLPLYLVRVPSLKSIETSLKNSTRLTRRAVKDPSHPYGSYSVLEDFTILRLLHVLDLEQATHTSHTTDLSTSNRLLTLFLIVTILPTILIFLLLNYEITSLTRHRKSFLATKAGGSNWEIGFLRTDTKAWQKRVAQNEAWWNGIFKNGNGSQQPRERRTSGMSRRSERSSKSSGLGDIGEAKLREVFKACGLGPEEGRKGDGNRKKTGEGYGGVGETGGEEELDQREVCVEGVYTVP